MDLKQRVEAMQDELVQMRRYFHQHPELGWHEQNTQRAIMEYLDKLGVPYGKAVETGVIATIKGKKASDKIIGIRADIDALPMQELAESEFKSQNDGVAHTCGHDTHITILLGTAKVLSEMKDELPVTVRLFFQPSEEVIENSGAAYMKDEPLIKECDRLIALHIWSKVPFGDVSLRVGPVLAACDTFDIHIAGKGGHGALPHQTLDPVVAGAELVNSLQRVVSREINPLDTAVISVTKFHSGTTSNIIPDDAQLSGTTRTFNNALRDQYPGILERVARGVGEATRTEITVDYHWGPPAMINDEACVKTGCRAVEKVFGEGHLVDYELQMVGEDFAKYTNPKCLMLLGGGLAEEALRYPQHSPYFQIDERALGLGVQYFVQYVLEYGAEQ